MSQRSPGGKFIDEMRLMEAIERVVRLEKEKDRQRLQKAEELMHAELYKLYVASKGLANVGAKMPLTAQHVRRLIKDYRRLLLKRKYLKLEDWQDRQDKFLIKIDELMFAAKRQDERTEFLPEAPYDGHEASDEIGWFGRLTRGAKRVITGEAKPAEGGAPPE